MNYQRLARWHGGKESASLLPEDSGDEDPIAGWERFPGKGNGNTLQYSCPENLMVRGAWQATAHVVAKEAVTTEWLNTYTHKNYQNSWNNIEEKEACIRNLATSLPQFIDFFFSYKSSSFLISSSVKFDFITRQALITMNAVNLCLFPKRVQSKKVILLWFEKI